MEDSVDNAILRDPDENEKGGDVSDGATKKNRNEKPGSREHTYT